MKFYIAEVTGVNVYAKADEVEAKNLCSAKRMASRRKCFYGTVLYIGRSVNSDGFIIDPVARKKEGEKWVNFVDE